MERKAILSNERGLTLVEILAALVILGIVFVGFMTVFPQMTKFNEKTETKLVTMNVAKQELTKIKSSPSSLMSVKKIKSSESPDLFETYIVQDNGDLYIEVDCYDSESQSCSGTGETNRDPKIHLIHIKVQKDGKLNSETFGYIEL